LKIANDTLPGTPIVVKNTIMGQALEERYDDNVLIFNETVNEPGPNLRVDKHTNWRWNWEGELQYELRILNVGTQDLENVVITDTYPVSTTMNKCWWNHGPGNLQPCTWDDATHQVIFRLDSLKSGETASANLAVDLTEDIGLQGLAYLNQADISNYGDVAPQDNHDEVTSYTGPDVFIHKWLKAGELRADELITYTVEFGNMNRWPWNGDPNYGSHITDTLPAGMTFIKAIPYWDPSGTFDPESINGQQVVWGWGPMWAEQTWTFDLVAQIDTDAPIGQELTNVIEAWGDSPSDVEINPDNNSFEYRLEDYPGSFGKITPADGSEAVSTHLTLSWSDSLNAAQYEYCVDTSDNDTCEGAWTSTGMDTSVDLSGLSFETTYYWQVRSLKVGGTTYSDLDSWWTFTTKTNILRTFMPLAQKTP
jgi:uncharacterized repeat protein (TIGR01451 family)